MGIKHFLPKLTRTSNRQKLEQDLEHITQEMYRRNKELADTNRTLSLLQSIDSLVLKSHEDIKILSTQISSVIAATNEYPLVAIIGPSNLVANNLETYGFSVGSEINIDSKILGEIKPTIHHQWFTSPEQSVFISILSLQAKDISLFLGCSEEAAEQLKSTPIKTIYIAKLVARQQIVGILAIGSTGPLESFGASERLLLERLTEAVGIALDNKVLFVENQLVLQELKKANSRLKELDQTKDEFISIASHQLRTPLTTIKGYLSMVLEGDVGPVTADERKMIQQAFDGADRMVFLIADLLNVSRLQSGKFVIENKPTDLAKMVESEVNLQKQIAVQRQLKLTLKKPDKLPLFTVDETKIRQVVMNFLDNAIYYTPAGGSIEVELALTDESINYTVTDTGLGVPKAVQSHLFSKFYRAENAKKMRPDGTGIGLFMAKKVIDAQGGTIIFQSEEGKGSTFGFSFPRHKVDIKEKTPLETVPAAVAP